jgi:hypothetical protein
VQPDKTVLPADGYYGPSPDLPPLAGKRRWLKVTRVWWEGWRHAPQAATFGATDWLFLLETAVLVESFHRGDSSLASEIRLRVSKLGATPEDRLRLRMVFGEAEVGGGEQAAQQPAASGDRWRRALKAVGDGEAT